jgi:hypothetical protein
MRRRSERKRDLEPLFRASLFSPEVLRDAGLDPEATFATVTEAGEARTKVMLARALDLAKFLSARARELETATPVRRYELSLVIERAWWAAAMPEWERDRRTAMLFVNIVTLGGEALRRGCARRALAKERLGLKLEGRDIELAKDADGVDRAYLDTCSSKRLGALICFAEVDIFDAAQRWFAAEHPRIGATSSSKQWADALDAAARTVRSKRKGAEGKWDVLRRVLNELGLWASDADELRKTWGLWQRGWNSSPLNRSSSKQQAARHEDRPSEPSRRRATRRR